MPSNLVSGRVPSARRRRSTTSKQPRRSQRASFLLSRTPFVLPSAALVLESDGGDGSEAVWRQKRGSSSPGSCIRPAGRRRALGAWWCHPACLLGGSSPGGQAMAAGANPPKPKGQQPAGARGLGDVGGWSGGATADQWAVAIPSHHIVLSPSAKATRHRQ
jgi:hypothetical protein